MKTDADRRACAHEWTEWAWYFPRVMFPNGTFRRDCPRCEAYQLTPSEAEHAALLKKFSKYPEFPDKPDAQAVRQ